MLKLLTTFVRPGISSQLNWCAALLLSAMLAYSMTNSQALGQVVGLGTPDFYAGGTGGGISYTATPVITGAPGMPPPPGVVGGSPVATTSQPVIVGQAPAITGQTPMVMGQPQIIQGTPPVAQGFGTNAIVAPGAVTVQPAPMMVQPAPATGVLAMDNYVRFVQAIRLQYTWISGDGKKAGNLGINDFEGAMTFAFPDFCFSQQPLLVTPGFILHLWSGPPTGVMPAIPPRAYSGYVDFFWAPQLSPRLTAELDFRVGLYSDFQSVTSNAIRPQGYGAGIYQMNQAYAWKLGATYINRVDIKVLPVIGIIWTPNPTRRWDITFPNPKISNYVTTWGGSDIWGYLAAEYGGGTWEIDDVGRNKMDINDIRIMLGMEWIGGWSTKGFIDVGYVFNRELVFQGPTPNISLDDAFMLRGGITF